MVIWFTYQVIDIPGIGDRLALESVIDIPGIGDRLALESVIDIPGIGDRLALESVIDYLWNMHTGLKVKNMEQVLVM